LEDYNFTARVREVYEQFVMQPGTYRSSDGVEKLDTGLRLDFIFPYKDMQGMIAGIVTVGDDSLEASQFEEPDWESFTSYEWSFTLSPSGKPFHWNVPAQVLKRFTTGNTVYRSNDLSPGVLNLKTIGKLSSVLGPDSTLGSGYDNEEIVMYVTPVIGVRPFGFQPVKQLTGALGVHHSNASYDASLADLALNYHSRDAHPISFPVPIGVTQQSAGAQLHPVVIDVSTWTLLQSFPTEERWPPIFGTTRADAVLAHDAGKLVAAFQLFVLFPGSGEYAEIVQNTAAVLEALGEEGDAETVATRDATTGEVKTRTFSAPTNVVSEAENATDDAAGGSLILDVLGDVALFCLELILAKKDIDNDFHYESNNGSTWADFVSANLREMLIYAASVRDGEAAESILEVLEILEEASGELIAVGATSGLTPILEFMGYYNGDRAIAGQGHPHLTSAELTEIEGKTEDSRVVHLNVMRSDVNPKVAILAPIQKQFEFGQPTQKRLTTYTEDYRQVPYSAMNEGYIGGAPVMFVSRFGAGAGGLPGSPLALGSLYSVANAIDGVYPIIHRDAFPFPDGDLDLTNLPYRDPADPSKRDYNLRFTGRVVGLFNMDTVTDGDSTSFSMAEFIKIHGVDATPDPDRRYGEYTSLWTGLLARVEDDVITGGNTIDPAHEYYIGALLTGIRRALSGGYGTGVDMSHYINNPWTNMGFVWEGVVELSRAPADHGVGLLGRTPKVKRGQEASSLSPWPNRKMVKPSRLNAMKIRDVNRVNPSLKKTKRRPLSNGVANSSGIRKNNSTKGKRQPVKKKVSPPSKNSKSTKPKPKPKGKGKGKRGKRSYP
jgi:hypothetical protein